MVVQLEAPKQAPWVELDPWTLGRGEGGEEGEEGEEGEGGKRGKGERGEGGKGGRGGGEEQRVQKRVH